MLGEPEQPVEQGEAGTQHGAAGAQQVAAGADEPNIRLKSPPPLVREQPELVGGQQLLLLLPKPVHPVCESRQPAAIATAAIRLQNIRIPFFVGRRRGRRRTWLPEEPNRCRRGGPEEPSRDGMRSGQTNHAPSRKCGQTGRFS
jgi:hypothetical protein